jgi:hypothetical protein
MVFSSKPARQRQRKTVVPGSAAANDDAQKRPPIGGLSIH